MAVSGTDVLWDMTATVVSSTQFVVCYRRLSASTAQCKVGIVATATQSITFGTALEVFDSANYIDGVVSNLYDSADRVVLAFAVSSIESGKIVVLGVSGSSLSTVTPSDLARFEYSSMVDHMALVALSRTSMLLAYRVRGGFLLGSSHAAAWAAACFLYSSFLT